jgi:hypothetical protein
VLPFPFKLFWLLVAGELDKELAVFISTFLLICWLNPRAEATESAAFLADTTVDFVLSL